VWNVRSVVSKGDYNYAVVPEHPFAIKFGYVLEHRIIMENHLGRLLTPDEIIHHINENKKDNRIENLQITTQTEHAHNHGTERGQLYVELICPECGIHFDIPKRQSFLQKGSEYTCCSRSCRGKFSTYIQYHGKTHEMELAISVNLVREYRKFPNSTDNTEQTAKQQDA